jgi:aspartate-semialdehyde dehydrogenase
MALWPLHQQYGIKKILCSTYQAASGAGQEGMEELRTGMEHYLIGRECKNEVFAHPLPFNVIPHIDKFQVRRCVSSLPPSLPSSLFLQNSYS